MTMTAPTDCLHELSALADTAERADLGLAQNILLRFALSHDGSAGRVESLDRLLAGLSPDPQAAPSPEQQAFRAALIDMIERTKIMVGPNGKDIQA